MSINGHLCRDIPSFDFWSKADPYVKVYYQFDAGSSYIFYGQTTASQDNPNPDWPQSFSFDFSGGDGNTQVKLLFGPKLLEVILCDAEYMFRESRLSAGTKM